MFCDTTKIKHIQRFVTFRDFMHTFNNSFNSCSHVLSRFQNYQHCYMAAFWKTQPTANSKKWKDLALYGLMMWPECRKRLNSFTALCYLFIFACVTFVLSFATGLFRESSSPQASDNSVRVISNFFEITLAANLPPIPIVSLISVANLPLVSTTPSVNLRRMSMTPVAICHRYQLHRRQISNKVNLKKNFYLYVDSTTKKT